MTQNTPFSTRAAGLRGTAALGALVAFGWLWGTQTQIAGAVISPGTLHVPDHRQMVQHSAGGMVQTLHVRNGDTVKRGQVLVSLDTQQVTQTIDHKRQSLMQFRAEAARLTATIQGAKSITWPEDVTDHTLRHNHQTLFDLHRLQAADLKTHARAEVTALRRTTKGLQHQRDSVQRRFDLGQTDLAAKQALADQGLLKRPALLALEQAQEHLIGQLAHFETQITAHHSQIDKIALRLQSAETEAITIAQTRLVDLNRQIESYKADMGLLHLQRDRLQVTAPADGVVIDLAVFGPGAVLQPAAPILQIVPNSTDLSIQAHVLPTHIDQISVGQAVTIVMPGLTDDSLPHLDAVVTRIAADAIPDPQSGQRLYTVAIDLTAATKAALTDHRLIPGMPVQAHIETAQHRPIDLLIDPIQSYFVQAFKES